MIMIGGVNKILFFLEFQILIFHTQLLCVCKKLSGTFLKLKNSYKKFLF